MSGSPTIQNARWAKARPTLSVLIPFLRDDPTDLLALLARESPVLAGSLTISKGTSVWLPSSTVSLVYSSGRGGSRNLSWHVQA